MAQVDRVKGFEEMQQTLLLLVNKVDVLEKLVRDQNEIIKSLSKPNQIESQQQNLTPTRISAVIPTPAVVTSQRPARAANVRAKSALTATGRKARGKELPPLLIVPTTSATGASETETVVSISPKSPTISVTPGPLDIHELVVSNDNWAEVKHKKSRAPVNVIKGTAAPGKTSLEASVRWKYYHLYYVKVGTTDKQILDHLNIICNSDVCTVESLKPKGTNYASFKIGVPATLADTVLAVDNWTTDICIKPWRFRSVAATKDKQ